jgi:hypothetical protein
MADSSDEGPLCPGRPLEHDFWLSRLCWARLSVQSFFLTALRCLYVGGGFSEYYRHPQCLHISQVCHFSISLAGPRHYSGICAFFSMYLFSFFLGLVLLPVFVELFHLDPKIAGALLIPITVIISYLGHSRFSFRQDNQAHHS